METDDVPGGAPNADTAARVREVIAAAGVSQREFARRVVMDPSKLSRSLSGTRRFTVAELARIADEGGSTRAGCSAPGPARRPRHRRPMSRAGDRCRSSARRSG